MWGRAPLLPPQNPYKWVMPPRMLCPSRLPSLVSMTGVKTLVLQEQGRASWGETEAWSEVGYKPQQFLVP